MDIGNAILHLKENEERKISFEIIPSKRDIPLNELEPLIQKLASYNPLFINVTSHPHEKTTIETSDGSVELVTQLRTGTDFMAFLINRVYKITAVPHVLCTGFDKKDTQNYLLPLYKADIHNVFAVRGDQKENNRIVNGPKNEYALDLVKQIMDFNNGNYLMGVIDGKEVYGKMPPTDFCVGIAGYPEKHFEARSLEEDILNTKKKIDAGAGYIITQMFFNNKRYFDYAEACKNYGINAPIIPGLKILSSKKQIESIPKMFNVQFPEDLRNKLYSAKTDEDVIDLGVNWAVKQINELYEKGIPNVHLFIMQDTTYLERVIEKL